jgi:hypothetical protein
MVLLVLGSGSEAEHLLRRAGNGLPRFAVQSTAL